MQATDVWDALIQWWDVPPEDAEHLWTAVAHSQALRAQVFRENLSLVTDQRTLTRFVHTCSPVAILQTVETLVREGRLSAYKAECIEACIRRRLDPSGQWRKR
jgi:hypothetical protein